MRAHAIIASLLIAGCAELGVVGDGTSVSMGKPNLGWILDPARIPDRGLGFTTRAQWRTRGNRYGTDELVDLLEGVARRMATHYRQRLVIADLSPPGGGPARAWHASHQSGRDADLLYYVRDREGRPVEPRAMIAFDASGKAKDGSGYTVDVPRMWALAKELLTAPEATVQWLFIYQPLADRMLEYAVAHHEPEELVDIARRALKQPGRAPHVDHMHVRIYCSDTDKQYGCVDYGPMDLLEVRHGHPFEVTHAAASTR